MKMKKSWVKVKKKTIDEEGGENQRMTIYKWIGKKSENDLEDVVKEIVLAIYTKEIKEKKEDKKYLPSLVDDLLGTLACSTLLRRRSTHKS